MPKPYNSIAQLAQLMHRQAEELSRLRGENYVLRHENAAKQARIDELMLEYCPNDMSLDQLANWATSQARYPADLSPRTKT